MFFLLFPQDITMNNVSESGWVSELQLGSQVLHTRALNKIQSPSKSSADPQRGTFVGKSILIAAAWSECSCRKVFGSSLSLAGIPLDMTATGLFFMHAGFFWIVLLCLHFCHVSYSTLYNLHSAASTTLCIANSAEVSAATLVLLFSHTMPWSRF